MKVCGAQHAHVNVGFRVHSFTSIHNPTPSPGMKLTFNCVPVRAAWNDGSPVNLMDQVRVCVCARVRVRASVCHRPDLHLGMPEACVRAHAATPGAMRTCAAPTRTCLHSTCPWRFLSPPPQAALAATHDQVVCISLQASGNGCDVCLHVMPCAPQATLAATYEKWITAWFSHPDIKAVLLWGFWWVRASRAWCAP